MTCKYCGSEDSEQHAKYTDRCKTCGERYNRYTAYKSQQKKNPTVKRQVLLDNICKEYRHLKARGFKVPRDIS